jgi:chaperonin GroEL
VPGGGVTLVNLAGTIKTTGHDAKSAGASLLQNALEQPFRILLENAGVNSDEWLPLVKKAKAGSGVDVNNPTKIVDLKASGVVDPARVTKEAIQNAVSIAGTSMTMGALVTDIPEAESASAPGAGGIGGMGGGMMGM